MANPGHLAVLAKGVEAWNEWRRQNPIVVPDLTGAHLIGAALGGIRFSDANLSHANLSAANLSAAKLARATLSRANLRETNLSYANLSEANLLHASLSSADLFKTYLRRANLAKANLRDANIEGADLRFSQLIACDLTCAVLTGARLYGTARDDWIIDGIKCEYVFWDANGEIRSPTNHDLARGEFEKLYRALPTVEYVFQDGMTPLDPLIMDRVVQAIREQNPDYDIQIDSISARGLAPSIRFTVQKEEQKEPALAQVTVGYEAKIRDLESRLDELRFANQRFIDRPGDTHIHVTSITGQYIALDGSTINIDQHVEYITNLRDTVAALPEDNPTFAKKTKKAALDIIGSALKDIAKGQVKKVAEQVIQLGKDLGPVIVNTAAYAFFKSCLGR